MQFGYVLAGKKYLRLIIVFSVAFSLSILVGPSSGNFHLPTVQLAHAIPEPCQTHGSSGACSQFWYPAGPAMDVEQAIIFTDQIAEYTSLISSIPGIDFPDSPLSPSQLGAINTSPNFLITAPVGEIGYYEVQFHLANSFWSCGFVFGNSNCGIQIRQAISHMIDKNAFTAKQAFVAGQSTPIDNPVPTTSLGGLTSPNPCGYDTSFPQSGPLCVAGASGGTSYHLASAVGANGYSWLPSPGSPDLNAAAQHFVIAGFATGFNSTTSILTGISSSAATNVPTFFIRNDDPPRLALGDSLASEICYLFTGSFTIPCRYLNMVHGDIIAFPGFVTSPTSINLNWWMYTAAYSYVPFFDSSLYFTYNSRFVSGIPTIQPPTVGATCSAQAVPAAAASNYMYLCSPTYDSLSSQMESAPSLAQAISFGVQAESYFGANAFTLPVFERTIQFGYPNTGWVRAINHNNLGLPNHFTWLNAWNPAPPLASTIRQGFSQTTHSVSPYIASTRWDLYSVTNVYDSLHVSNPLAPGQSINWMTIGEQQVSNSSLTYAAPAHTLTTYRFILRPDLYFQDGRPVTAYDVAFSYLSLVGSGAYLGTGATPMTGITVLGPRQFDIGVNSVGPFVLSNLTLLPVVPARYWTNAGSTGWDSASMTCAYGCPASQYTLSGSSVNCALGCSPFSAGLMTITPADVAATFDPIGAHVFLGSGPWTCGLITSSGSGTCTDTFQQNPFAGHSYVLTRFGNGLTPASSTTSVYFRSSGDLALWTWASNGNPLGPDIITVSQVVLCFGQPNNPSCRHWQQGIGASATGLVGINQVSIVMRFFGVNWVAPFNWALSPPTGIGPFAPVLYEGTVTLNPCSIDPINGYDC